MNILQDKKIITFDCYGTLIDWETGILKSLKESMSIGHLSDHEILKMFASAESKIQKEDPAMLYEKVLEKVIKNIAGHLSIKINDENSAVFARSVRTWIPFNDTIGALQKLSSKYKLVIISNIDNLSIKYTKSLLKVDFFRTYTAQDIGAYKPDLIVFEYVFDKLESEGYLKSEILHVAESLYHDHVPAKKMGFDSVWINRRHDKSGNGATPNVGKEWIPDYMFTDLSSFADWALKGG